MGWEGVFFSVLRRKMLKIVFEAWTTLYFGGTGAVSRGHIGTVNYG